MPGAWASTKIPAVVVDRRYGVVYRRNRVVRRPPGRRHRGITAGAAMKLIPSGAWRTGNGVRPAWVTAASAFRTQTATITARCCLPDCLSYRVQGHLLLAVLHAHRCTVRTRSRCKHYIP